MTKSFNLRKILPFILATMTVQGVADTDLPAAVADKLAGMAEDCATVGGVFDPADAIALADLTGDGITDYVLQTQELRCSTAVSLFTGNSGGQVIVYQGSATGDATLAFQFGVGDANIDRQLNPAQLVLALGGKFCGQAVTPQMSRADYQHCWRPLLWDQQSRQFELAPVTQIRPIR